MIQKLSRIGLRLGLGALLLLPGAVPVEAQEEDYRIGPDDVLRILVWQRQDLSGQYSVDQQGNLTMPLAGTIAVAGMTAQELATDLERRLVIMDPAITQVLVTITGYYSQRFTIVGEVRSPGTYNFREFPTLWDVILMAGGETPAADMGGVQIRRDEPGGGSQTITVDLSGGLDGTPQETIPVLLANDQIIVPSLTGRGGLSNSVQILGAVRNPGSYSLRIAPTVVKAMSASGGPMEYADLTAVQLTRKSVQGATVFELDLDAYLKDGYPPADLPLEAGDTMTIPVSGGGFSNNLSRILQVSGFLSTAVALLVAINNLNN